MAILGNNVKGAGARGFQPGRLWVTKSTLATPMTLTELHGWVSAGSPANTFRLVMYADSSGVPGARVAYTNVLTLTSTDVERSQTGLSVSLTAGSYWLGFLGLTDSGSCFLASSPASVTRFINSGASDPPPDPFGTSGGPVTDENLSVWAVVSSAATTPVADFTGTPLTGLAPLSVAFTDTSTNTPTSWAWDFGDGTTSTSQNPSHSYTTSGTYTVALIATNTAGSNSKTRTAYITATETIVYAPGGGIEIY